MSQMADEVGSSSVGTSSMLTPRSCKRVRGVASEFVSDQATSLLTGKVHHTPRLRKRGRVDPSEWTTFDQVVMSASCMAYLLCSMTWAWFGFAKLASWFVLVSFASTVADGIRVPWAPIRVFDRIVGSLGLVTSMVVNCTSVFNVGLVVVTAVSALYWLRASRAAAVRATTLAGHRRYVLTHATWHVWGAIALCAMTTYVQSAQA